MKLARLTVEELHELKWLTGGLLALLAVWSLSALDMGLGLHVLIGGLLIGLALFRPGVVAAIPTKAWHWVGPLILLLVLADFIFSIPQMIPPLVRTVIMLLLYRVLAPRRKREDLQLVLVCLFCLVISGALTVSLLFGFQMLLFAPLAMAFLFVVCLLDRGKQSPAHTVSWQHFGWGRLIRRIAEVLDWRVLAIGGLLYCFIMVVSSFLFVLIPRFNLEQAMPFLQLGTKSLSGFSEQVQLGEVSDISEDQSVAMRVDVPSLEALEPLPYWRMLVLDEYEAGGFRMSAGLQTNKLRNHESTRELLGQRPLKSVANGERWTFYLEGGISRYLPVPGPFRRMRFQTQQEMEWIPDVHVFGSERVWQSVFFYQLEDFDWARRLSASPLEVEAFSQQALTAEEAGKAQYPLTTLELNLSDAEIAWLATVNRRETGGVPDLDAARYSQKITDFLWRNYRYSLSPDGGAESGDPVVGWLQTGQRGHCELFAASLILLARQAGYPARMVVGFAGGSWNPVEAYFIVRNSDAHAWVEIFDARTNEWLRVDPTPGSGSSDPEVPAGGSVEFESGWGAWFDSLRIQWYRRIVNFDEQDQMDLAMALKDVFDEMRTTLSARLKATVARAKVLLRQPLKEIPLVGILFVGFVGLALWQLWRFRFACLRWLAVLLKRPESLDPVRRQAGRYLSRLKLKQAQRGEGDWSEAVSAMREKLEALRFGPRVGEAEARSVFKQARRLLRGI